MDIKTKNNKGITIITLVITILILLILASITIKTVSDQMESINSTKGISEETEVKSNVINNQVDILYDELSPNK